MSCGGTATVSPKESQTFKRAVRKVRVAGLVASLAKGWQGWAAERTERQEALPSGWVPSSVEEAEPKAAPKLAVTPRAIAADGGGSPGSLIRGCAVARTVRPKRSEVGSLDLVNAIRDKMEAGPEEGRRYLGNESPTRRRQMRALQEGGGGGGIREKTLMLQEKKVESRSSSVDTEDSGLGEEHGLSDHGDAKPDQDDVRAKRQASRPKVRRTFTPPPRGPGGRSSSM